MSTINIAIDSLVYGSAVWFTVKFTVGLFSRYRKQQVLSEVQPLPEVVEVADVHTEETISTLPDPWQIEVEPVSEVVTPLFTNPPTLLLLPPAKPSTPNYADLNSEQLRKLCQQHSIKWRGRKGQKHMSKKAMVAALEAIAA